MNAAQIYIGQLERGEKNAIIESIEKVANALDVSLETIFEKLGDKKSNTNALMAYNLMLKLLEEKQAKMLELFKQILEL